MYATSAAHTKFGRRSIRPRGVGRVCLSRVVAFLALIVVLPMSAPAAAQDVAGAEALFSKGVSEMGAGHFDVACPMLIESQHLDPRPGTLFTIAECNGKAGKVATAAAHYEDYLRAVRALPPPAQAKHATRIVVAQTQLDALRPTVPMLTLTLASTPPPVVRIRRDTSELTATSLGLALPIDPGEHVVLVESAGRKPAEKRFTIEMGESMVIDLTPLVDVVTQGAPPQAAAVPPRTAAAPLSTKETGSNPSEDAARDGNRTRRIAAYSVGSAGLASLVVGAVAGAIAVSDKSTVNGQCTRQVCSQTGIQAANDGKAWSAVSTVGLAVGGAALAGGAVLYITSSSSAKSLSKSTTPEP